MKRRLLAIAMTLAMALSLLPVTALAGEADPATGTLSSVTETDGSDQTNESLDEGTQTDTETPDAETEASTDETGTATTTEESDQVDSITTEDELIEAISGAEAGEKITLAEDITLNSQLTIGKGKEIVLDLYGHTLNAGSNTISVTDGSSLTIETSSGKGKITAEKQIEVDSASLTLNSGEIEITGISDKSYGIYVLNNGFVTVNNGTINSNYAALAGNNTTGDMNFEVNGGQLSAKNGPAIYMPGQVQLLITNGTIDGGISLRMGQVKISGGTINAVTANIDSPEKHYNYSGNAWLPDALYVFNGTYESDNGKYGNSLNLEITGGTFNCTNDQGSAVAIYDIGRVAQKSAVTISGKAVMTNSAEGRSAYQVLSLGDIGVENPASGYGKYVGDIESSITGGTFSTDVSAYVADGHICEKSDNNYVVSKLNANNSVAQVGDEYYATLAKAVSAAVDGDTVTLLADTTLTQTIEISGEKAITLSLNGYNISCAKTHNSYALKLSGGIDLTITGEGTISSNNRVILVGDSAYNGSSKGTSASLTLDGGCTISTDYVQDDGDEWYQCAITVNANNTSDNDVIPCVVTINNATVTGAVYLFGRGAELNVNKGAVLTSTSSYAIGGNGGGTHGGTEINITGGTIEQRTTEAVKSGTAIYHPQDGTLNISGNPTITGYTGIQLCSGEGVVANITGGTVTATGEDARESKTSDGVIPDGAAISIVNRDYPGGTPKMNISGGTFVSQQSSAVLAYTWSNNSSSAWEEADQYLSITGGTYTNASNVTDDPVSAYCPTGYAATKATDGNTWTVGPKQGMEAEVSAGADNTASATVDGSYTGTESGSGSDDGSVTAGATIQINVTTGESGAASESVTKTEVTVGTAALESVQKASGVQNVEITTDVGTMTLDKNAWNSIADNAGNGSVTLTIQKSEDADGPADWTVSAVDESGNPVFSSENERSGKITISVPYKGTVSDGSQVVVYYIGENGQLESMVTNCQNNTLSWTTDHLSDFGSVTIDADDEAVWVSDNTLQAGSLAEALEALDSTGGTIDLIRSATLDSAKYVISSNVTIQKSANPLQQGELTITATVAAGPGTGAFNITADASLTLDGVKMTINGTKDTENQGGKYDGTGFILDNTDSGTGGKLILTNANVELNDLQRGMVFQVTASNLSSVEMTNSQLTIQNIDGNATNGGVWTVGKGSTVTVQNCGNHGLSASSVTVESGATVAVSDVGYRGISINDAGGKLEIQTGGTVIVTDACTAEGYDGSAVVMSDNATGGLQVEQGGTLTVTGANSEIQLSDADGVTNKLEGNITGTYTGAVIMVGDRAFEDLAEALTAAGNSATDKTVTLLGDVETSTAISIPEGVTLDGNDHSITYTGTPASTPQNGAFITVNTGADDVTIQDVTINAGTNFKHGVQFYCNDGGTLDNVKIIGGAWTSVLVNGATNVTIEETTLMPGADAYANIEYAMGDGVNTADQIPSLTVDNVTFTPGIPQIWVDDTTVNNMKTAMGGSPTDTEIVKKVNDSITNKNSGDITVRIELKDGNVTNSTIDGTDDDDHGGSSGGGSSVTRYTVSVEDTDNGSIRVSPSRASRGQTVTITVDPDEGYELDRLVVWDADGDRIDLERKSDTKYTFEMPRGKVTVEATFTEIEEEDAIPFRDVDTDDWFYDAVVYAYDTGLMSGVSDDQFAPDATLTRAMVAQMLYSLEGKPRTGSAGYADVAFGAWYEDAVAWISSEGLMTGYSDAAFGPNDPLTREQLALILYNYADWAGYDVRGGVSLGSYIDADSASTWAVEALEWAIDAGLISGRGDGILAPAGTATRAEVAQIFMNFLENVAQ